MLGRLRSTGGSMNRRTIAGASLVVVLLIGGGCKKQYDVVGVWDAAPVTSSGNDTTVFTFNRDLSFETQGSQSAGRNGRTTNIFSKGTYIVEGSKLLLKLTEGAWVTTNGDGSLFRKRNTPLQTYPYEIKWQDADHVKLISKDAGDDTPWKLTRRQSR
jgi:hypothetical protein